MKKSYSRVTPLVCFTLLFCTVGCGGSDRPGTSPVTGTVTVSGSPVSGASVTFYPLDDGNRTAFAVTNDQGEFSLTTFDDGDGAIPGQYKVAIRQEMIKNEIDPGQLTPNGGGNAEAGMDMYKKMMVGAKPESSTQSTGAVPGKYGDPNTSGLQRTVEDSDDNEFNFKLDG